ncbi:secreted RxLR effector protein 161-like [Cryptomeria japonica]|uniref:secreted RxLR effector protein 161-like n=1 Tax=Cryptomeria japonica TaxID=3369 RepID=UPI0027DA3C89|nr:secreted RxLR effector protein 161-like [Cryptomeria japonica]
MTRWKLRKDDESPSVDQTLYKSMIGSLLYLTASRLNIVQAICMVARFQETPKQSHVNAVRRIFRYLQGTLTHDLWYPKKGDFTLQGYAAVDWVGCIDDRKSTSGGDFFFGERLVSWNNKKQDSISLSMTKVEYMIAATCCPQVLWMKQT